MQQNIFIINQLNIIYTCPRITNRIMTGPCLLAFMALAKTVWDVGISGKRMLKKRALFCYVQPFLVTPMVFVKMLGSKPFGARSVPCKRIIASVRECSLL